MEMEPSVPASAASAAGSGDSAQATPCWTSSTNWTIRDGSLQDAICFESSASILEEDGAGVDDGGAVPVSGGLLLTRPGGQESSPCEITICFRERHEIHRIYVRSTARVYEIYYASALHDRGNEYLCTVRCGPSGKEVFLPRCDSEEAVVSSSKAPNASMEVCGKISKSESNTSGEEDGWVEVKIPDSPLLGDRGNTFSMKQDEATGANSQIYYEATADISDASPCTSVILRLLSLQTKECVHIEEVYIYADPLEFTDSDPPVSMTGNMTRDSLLAMLVPSMLQLPKAGGSKIQDRTASHNPAVQKHGHDTSMTTEEMSSEIAREGMPRICSNVVKEERASSPTMVNETIAPSDSGEVPGPPHVPEPIPEKTNVTHGPLEKKLDELVLRVGRIENFLSKFEENMLKPLSCIDLRLQQVELQLHALSFRAASSNPFQCSRISAPEFQFDECDSDGDCDISVVAKEDATVDSPDAVKEEATVNSPDMGEEDATVDGSNVVEDMPAGGAVLPGTDGTASLLDPDVCPGLVMKAPEFVNEEDEHVSSNDISEFAPLACPKAKASLSIDDALTSALKAFIMSTSTNSPKNGMASVAESQSSKVAVDNPKLDENVLICEAAEMHGTVFNETNRVCGVSMDSGTDITSPKEGEGQGTCCEKWHQGSFGGLTTEEVFSNNQFYVGRDDSLETDENNSESRKETDDDSGIDEAPNEVLNITRGFKGWNDESSSDSNIDESMTESHHNMDWLDETSTDSENESFTLRNWLYGRQDDHRFNESRFMGAMGGSYPKTELGGKSVRCNQDKSKVEIQKALNSSQNELKGDVQQILNSSLSNESSLLDVQFVRREKSNYAIHLDALLMDMVDSETEVHGNDWLNDVGPSQQCNPHLGAPVADDNLLIDLEEAMVKNNNFSTEGSSNQQLFSSLI